jgi:sulfur relay (sulfurtransferase) complex TusBCD TusD component (DsrE family)
VWVIDRTLRVKEAADAIALGVTLLAQRILLVYAFVTVDAVVDGEALHNAQLHDQARQKALVRVEVDEIIPVLSCEAKIRTQQQYARQQRRN